jgi:hypothetical protein
MLRCVGLNAGKIWWEKHEITLSFADFCTNGMSEKKVRREIFGKNSLNLVSFSQTHSEKGI